MEPEFKLSVTPESVYLNWQMTMCLHIVYKESIMMWKTFTTILHNTHRFAKLLALLECTMSCENILPEYLTNRSKKGFRWLQIGKNILFIDIEEIIYPITFCFAYYNCILISPSSWLFYIIEAAIDWTKREPDLDLFLPLANWITWVVFEVPARWQSS